MTKGLILALGLCLAIPGIALAEWEICISGTGALPTVQSTMPPSTPPTPPVTPPPPPPPPVVSNDPFLFPYQPYLPEGDPAVRYFSVGTDTLSGQFCYRADPYFPNPSPGSHLFAGFTPSGDRLWVARNAAPSSIRRALAGGRCS